VQVQVHKYILNTYTKVPPVNK